MSKFRTSTIVMAVCSMLMLVGLVLPYLQSTDQIGLKASVVQIIGGDISGLVPEDTKTVYTFIAGGVAACALFGLLSLTSKKVFGAFAIILSLIVAAFHGFLLAALGDRQASEPGIGFWIILVASLVLLVTSIGFVTRKNRPLALTA